MHPILTTPYFERKASRKKKGKPSIVNLLNFGCVCDSLAGGKRVSMELGGIASSIHESSIVSLTANA